MAFKKVTSVRQVPDSPEKILLDLPRRKIPGVLLHQGEIIKSYVAKAIDKPNVAFQLPTGSGKTLVGLLVAEWRRLKFKERVVYLCPTNQLVNQVVEQAEEQYGLSVRGFSHSVKDYKVDAKAEYQSADSIAVTTYSALFNTNPYFANADIIIIDDAHASENYISGHWTVRIERNNRHHKKLHLAVSNLLRPFLGSTNYERLMGNIQSTADLTWVDKLPTPYLEKIIDEFITTVDEHISDLTISYPWSVIKGHLLGCHVYLSPNDILVRPLIPPTWTHSAFTNAKQRIFMSATLGLGGDLERLTGVKQIFRLPVPEGWDRQGIGRRFFMFPGMSLEDSEVTELRHKLMAQAERSLVLVPSDAIAKKITEEIESELSFKVFTAEDIEESKKPFIAEKQAVAIVANRYDGIDFPGEDCRLLFMVGLPKTTNSQERFLMARMGAGVLFSERIQTRVLQALGRCTRSLEDYSAVIVTGEELSNYLTDIRRRSFLHSELQAELTFGLEQSKDTTLNDFIDNFKVFHKYGKEWEQNGNAQIVANRSGVQQNELPSVKEMMKTVQHEIKFQEAMWQEDFEKAYDAAESVIAELVEPGLRGYRALWHYLAGSAASLGKIKGKDRIQFEKAKEAASGISWLVALSRYQTPDAKEKSDENAILIEQLERVEAILENLGISHSRNYTQRENQILEGIEDPDKFEQAHLLLGEMLGFKVGKVESDGSPDPWWIAGNICFVFEDNAGAESEVLGANKARQAASHPNWIRDNVALESNTLITSILLTSKTKAKEGAIPHLKDVKFWELNEFKKWANDALGILRVLRRRFEEPGNLLWRMEAIEAFKNGSLDAPSILKTLQKSKASEKLKPVK